MPKLKNRKKECAAKPAPHAVTADPRPWLDRAPPRIALWTTRDVTELQRRLAVEAGRDPKEVPDLPFRTIRMSEMITLTGLSQSTLYLLVKKGVLPRGIPADMSTIINASKGAGRAAQAR